jgi:hypothetical protein
MPESSAMAVRRGAGLDQRVVGEGLARLRRQLDSLRQRLDLVRSEQGPELPDLVRVACGEYQAHQPVAAACASRSCSMPAAASASISSSEARESGVRSAVACTSTSPPSPVITTFMSTSAVESSG